MNPLLLIALIGGAITAGSVTYAVATRPPLQKKNTSTSTSSTTPTTAAGSQTEPAATPSTPTPTPIASTYKQTFAPGVTVTLNVGDTIEIDAPYAPTGGNRWNFESSSTAVFATYACATAMNATSGDFPVSNLTQAQCTGYALTNDIGYYKAVATGTATLSLSYGNGTTQFSGVMTIQVNPAGTPAPPASTGTLPTVSLATTYKQTFAANTTIALKVGDTIEIDPPYPPIANMRWMFVSDSNSLLSIEQSPSGPGSETSLDTGFYEASAAGEFEISLGYYSTVAPVGPTGVPVFNGSMVIQVSAA